MPTVLGTAEYLRRIMPIAKVAFCSVDGNGHEFGMHSAAHFKIAVSSTYLPIEWISTSGRSKASAPRKEYLWIELNPHAGASGRTACLTRLGFSAAHFFGSRIFVSRASLSSITWWIGGYGRSHSGLSKRTPASFPPFDASFNRSSRHLAAKRVPDNERD